jgi:hypothetical protein
MIVLCKPILVATERALPGCKFWVVIIIGVVSVAVSETDAHPNWNIRTVTIKFYQTAAQHARLRPQASMGNYS